MGRNTPAALAALASHLHTERDALRAFVTLLETEQQALLDGQVEQLLTLADSKTQAAHELKKLGNILRNEMLAHGVGTESGGMETWLQTHAAGSLPVWRDIRQLSTHAQQQNHTNGELIKSKLRHNQQALTVLHIAARSASSLYGPDGQPNLPVSGHILGRG